MLKKLRYWVEKYGNLDNLMQLTEIQPAAQSHDSSIDYRVTDALRSRSNNFDFLRLLAATLVILHHTPILSGQPHPLNSVTGTFHLGHLAVGIFFVISGFLVTASIVKSDSVLEFVIARFARVIPALAAALVITVFVIGPLNTCLNLSLYFSAPSTWSYLHNIFLMEPQFDLPGVFTTNPFKDVVNGSLWTIPIEAFMYFVTFSLAIFKLHKRPLAALALFVTLVILDMHYFTLPEHCTERFLWLPALSETARYAVFYTAGAVLYLFRSSIRLNRTCLFVMIGLFLGSLFTPYVRLISYFSVPYVIIYFAFARIPFLSRAGRFGDFSYGLYLYAFPIQQTIINMTHSHINPVCFFIGSLFSTLILAVASWNLIEKPALALKSQLNLFLRSSRKTPVIQKDSLNS
jgi:peptidoglycan/LPS O-acetylase OafA/YrhL